MEKLNQAKPYATVYGISSHRYEQDGKKFDAKMTRIVSASELKAEAEAKKKKEAEERKRLAEEIKRAEKREEIIGRLADAEEELQEALTKNLDDDKIREAEDVVEFIVNELKEFDESV